MMPAFLFLPAARKISKNYFFLSWTWKKNLEENENLLGWRLRQPTDLFFHRKMIMISNIPGFDYHIGIGRYEFKLQSSTTIVSKIFLSMLRFWYPLIEFVVNWQMHHNWTIRNCAFVSCRTLLLDLGSGTLKLFVGEFEGQN